MFWILMGILFRMAPFCSGNEGAIVGQLCCPTCNCLRQLYPRHLLALLGPTDLPNAVKNYENYYFINTNFANRLTYKRRGPRGEHFRKNNLRLFHVYSPKGRICALPLGPLLLYVNLLAKLVLIK